MQKALLLLLVILPASPGLRSAEPAPTARDKAATTEGSPSADEQLRRIMEQDDAAEEEVLEWIKADAANRRPDGSGADPTLRIRVEQRLQPVKRAYEQFILRHPDHVEARLAFGSFLNDIDDEYGARDQWEKARELDPSNPAAWNNLANYYGHRGPVRNSFEYYAKAIELSPDEPVYYQNLATTVFLFRKDAMEFYDCTEDKVFARSLELYRKAIALDPDNFLLAADYAQSFYIIKPPPTLPPDQQEKEARRLTDEAIDAWNYALKLARDEVQREGIHIHLARVNLNANRFAEARSHLNSVTNAALAQIKARIARNVEQKEARQGEAQ